MLKYRKKRETTIVEDDEVPSSLRWPEACAINHSNFLNVFISWLLNENTVFSVYFVCIVAFAQPWGITTTKMNQLITLCRFDVKAKLERQSKKVPKPTKK